MCVRGTRTADPSRCSIGALTAPLASQVFSLKDDLEETLQDLRKLHLVAAP